MTNVGTGRCRPTKNATYMLIDAERSDEPQDSGREPVNDLEQKKLGDDDPQAS
jgi:hypothetical protein